jgi:hypothetical protein
MTLIFPCKLLQQIYMKVLFPHLYTTAAGYCICFSVLQKVRFASRSADGCSNARLGVPVAVDIRVSVFWNMKTCSLVEIFRCANHMNFISVLYIHFPTQQNDYFAFRFVWVWNLVSHIEGGT